MLLALNAEAPDEGKSNYSKDRSNQKGEKRGVCETMREKRKACGVLMGKTEGRHHLENLSVDWGIILKWIFKK